MAISLVQGSAAPKTRRRGRYPLHTWQTKARPWTIQPVMIAPVLAGESMKSAFVQARVVTDNLNERLIGWWHEYYLFFVGMSHLDGKDDFREMFLDLDKDLSSYNEAANTVYNHYATSINWPKLCLKKVVERYFRDEGEAWDVATLTGPDGSTDMPSASIGRETFINSIITDTEYDVPDFDADLTGDTIYTASEIQRALSQYTMLRESGMFEDMSWEDYLQSQGVNTGPMARQEFPELLRAFRQWVYPANTIDPSDGSAVSVCSWSPKFAATKRRYFREPGFLLMVSVSRPKVYLSNLDGNGTSMLNTAMNWLPSVFRDDPHTSMKWFATGTGPVSTVSDANGYWVDVKDLFIYGDQFKNFSGFGNDVTMPDADLDKKYGTSTDADGLFVDAAGGNKYVDQDGACQLAILGHLMDTSLNAPK